MQAQPRQDQDAEHLVVEQHRGQQHRFIKVVLRAWHRPRPGVRRGIPQVLGDPIGGHPSGDPLAERDPELVGRLVDVFADLTLHRHRDQFLPHEPVDTGIVVVDQLAQFGRDRLPDLRHAGQAVEPRAKLLDRLQLCSPCGHPLEILGRPDRDADLGRQGFDGIELGLRPAMRTVVVDIELAEDAVTVEQWRGAEGVEPLLDHGRPHLGAARVISVAHRENGMADGHGIRQQSPNWHRLHTGQVFA